MKLGPKSRSVISAAVATIGLSCGDVAAAGFGDAYNWVWRAGERFHLHGRIVPDCLGLPSDQQVRQRVYVAAYDHKVHALVIMETHKQDPYLEHFENVRVPSGPAWLTSPSGRLRKTCYLDFRRREAKPVNNELYRADFEIQKRYFIAMSQRRQDFRP